MDSAVKRPALIERVCDAFLVGFGTWTLACHVAVGLGLGLKHVTLFGLILSAGLALWALGSGARTAARREPDGRTPSNGQRLAALSLGLLSLVAAALGAPIVFVWGAAVLGLGLALWSCRSDLEEGGVGDESNPGTPAPGRIIFLVAFAFALIPLAAHRGSPDDGFYVNVAAHAVAHPEAPLLERDTLHGIEELPIMYSVYRLHSFELLGAALARVTGIEAVRVMHSVLSFGAAFLAVLACGRLLRRLLPDRWVLATLAAVLVLALEGEVPQSIGTFSTLRFQQGKALLLAVLLPLIVSAAIDFARHRTLRSFGLLALGQVGALGASVTAIWLAPAVAGLALLAGATWNARGVRRVAIGLSTSFYPLVAGLFFLAKTREESALETERAQGVQLVAHGNEPITDGGALIGATWETVMGSGSLALAALGLAVLGWSLAPNALARRFAIVFPLGLALVFLNPFTSLFIANNVTGGPTFWRVLWLLPWGVLWGLLAAAPLSRGGRRPVQLITSLALLGVLGSALFGTRGLTQGVRWCFLDMNLPEEALEHARALAGAIPDETQILAPRQIGTTLLQIDGTRTPIVSHRNWLNIQRHRVGLSETDRRLRLLDYVIGLPQPNGALFVRDAVLAYDLHGVSFQRGTANTKTIRRTLEGLGFANLHTTKVFETWVKPAD